MTDIGSFGIASLRSHVKILMTVASILTIVCVILFIVVLSGNWNYDSSNNNSDRNSMSQSQSWATANIKTITTLDLTVSIQQYYYLEGFYSFSSVSGHIYAFSSSYSLYSDCKNNYIIEMQDDEIVNLCPSCMNAGRSALSLILVAIFLTFLVGTCGFIRGYFRNAGAIKILAIVTNSMAFLFLIVALSVWYNQCYTRIQKEINNNLPSFATATLTTTAGLHSIIAGSVFLFIILIIHTLTPSSQSNSEEDSASLIHNVSPLSEYEALETTSISVEK